MADPRCRHSFEPQGQAQVIHGDYHPDDRFYRAAEVSSIIDWDNAMRMPRAYELARAYFFICQMRPSQVAVLLAGYRSVTPISARELEDGAATWE